MTRPYLTSTCTHNRRRSEITLSGLLVKEWIFLLLLSQTLPRDVIGQSLARGVPETRAGTRSTFYRKLASLNVVTLSDNTFQPDLVIFGLILLQVQCCNLSITKSTYEYLAGFSEQKHCLTFFFPPVSLPFANMLGQLFVPKSFSSWFLNCLQPLHVNTTL